jgi:hypothetical protein
MAFGTLSQRRDGFEMPEIRFNAARRMAGPRPGPAPHRRNLTAPLGREGARARQASAPSKRLRGPADLHGLIIA